MRDLAPPLARDRLVTASPILFGGKQYAKGEPIDVGDMPEWKLRNMVRARKVIQGEANEAPAEKARAKGAKPRGDVLVR